MFNLQSHKLAPTRNWEPSYKLNSLELPGVFNRLYQHDQGKVCCEACKKGPACHNHPDKKHNHRSVSRKSSNRLVIKNSRGSSKNSKGKSTHETT